MSHIYVCICVCVYMCRCVRVHTHVRGRIYIYIYIHTHTCMGTHTHTHTCIHACAYIQLIVSHIPTNIHAYIHTSTLRIYAHGHLNILKSICMYINAMSKQIHCHAVIIEPTSSAAVIKRCCSVNIALYIADLKYLHNFYIIV